MPGSPSSSVAGSPPPPPPTAREIFGARLPLAERYAALLAGPGVERGLIGPHEVARLWDRHILNCAVVAELINGPCALTDIGSGAGLPGIVLAIILADVRVTLVEPRLRPAVFLGECTAALGLINVAVRRARAEDVVGEIVADVVTARAVAPLGRLAALAVPLTRPGGTILALKGDRAAAELAAARRVLAGLRVRHAEILSVGRGKVEPETAVVRIVVGDRGRAGPPRRAATGRRLDDIRERRT